MPPESVCADSVRAHPEQGQSLKLDSYLRLEANPRLIGSSKLRLTGRNGRRVELTGPGVALLPRVLALMDGSITTERLLAGLPVADRKFLREFLTALLAQGLLLQAHLSAPRREWLAVVGIGPLAMRLRAQLSSTYRVHWFADTLTTMPLMDGRSSRAAHWTQLADHPHDLVVLATGTRALDPALAWLLIRSGTPHLLAQADKSRGHLSSLVVPGVTACLDCQRGPREWQRSGPERAQRIFESATPESATLEWTVTVTSAVVAAHLRSGRLTAGNDTEGGNWPVHRPSADCPMCGHLLRTGDLPTAA